MATVNTPKTPDAAAGTKPTVEDDEEIVLAPKKAKKEERSPEEIHKDMLQKYKAASVAVHKTVESLVEACIEGASIMKLCVDGDEQITKWTSAVYTMKVDGAAIPRGNQYPSILVECGR